jgi:DNA-binding beta-propeller fold protein YncE
MSTIEAKVKQQTTSHGMPRRQRKLGRGYFAGLVIVLGCTAICVFAFIGLMLRPKTDSGIRVWMLNHAPDQVVIINPFDGVVEKEFLVADGLRGLAFSRDNTTAYFYNVVDVSNRLKALDTKTYLTEETIEVDGVPQGIGVFPDNRKLAVILGSKTDFMAGGFDVLDLNEQSKANPQRKRRLYRERGLALTHKIAVADDGDRIYCIDAKSDKIHVFSYAEQQKIKEIDLYGAPEEMLYPRAGNYYYVSVLQHRAIYQLSKATDSLEAVYIYQFVDQNNKYAGGKLRHMAVDSKARYLIGTNYEEKTVAIWDLKNRNTNDVAWKDVPYYPESYEKTYRFEKTHYLPITRFKLKGGYDPSLNFIPGGQQVAVDPLDEYLFVVDEYGALYVYDFLEVLKAQVLITPEPRELVGRLASSTTEIRDLKVSQPAVR